MTYLELLAVALGAPIAWLLVSPSRNSTHDPIGVRLELVALAVVCALALGAALPWDAALLHRGTWSYPHGLTLGRVFGVPVEEVLFMLTQPALVGLWLHHLGRRHPPPESQAVGRSRMSGAALWLGAAAVGLVLARRPSLSYLGYLLAWAGPLLALQWAVGGDRLRATWRGVVTATVPPTLYLGLVDHLALHLHLWQLSPRLTSGLVLAGLPVEELLFFALTNLLVVGGLVLATDPVVIARLVDRGRRLIGSELLAPRARSKFIR